MNIEDRIKKTYRLFVEKAQGSESPLPLVNDNKLHYMALGYLAGYYTTVVLNGNRHPTAQALVNMTLSDRLLRFEQLINRED